ncbi:UpxY family transcription antiterminator [Spongiimicrobium salis]|uniref:UpxY family transcription antiterminator n=1 Tax=Spongiimicrobium salis TaxID=1667022 RepID=UPI00374CF2E2
MGNIYSGWYVLYVKFQHEKRIDLVLKESGFESFLPTITVMRQWADRKKKVVKPLFPTYIFLKIHSKQDFFKVLDIHGVFKYIKFGGNYAKLHDSEIEKIKYFLNLDGVSEIDTISNIPAKGELMLIDFGPLKGLNCEVLKTNNKNRVFVRVDSLKRNITAIVPLKYLCQRSHAKIEAL